MTSPFAAAFNLPLTLDEWNNDTAGGPFKKLAVLEQTWKGIWQGHRPRGERYEEITRRGLLVRT